MAHKIEIILFDEDSGEEVTHLLPSENELCHRCGGDGVHTNPNIDGDGITESEMAEILHEDPDFLEDYQNGLYDITCQVCHGNKVIQVPDEQACSPEQLEILQRWNVLQEEIASADEEDRYTYRMESGF